jgi:hypothetical protein
MVALRKPKRWSFDGVVILSELLNVGGFYLAVALQNQKTEGTVHTKHQELKQSNNQASKRH